MFNALLNYILTLKHLLTMSQDTPQVPADTQEAPVEPAVEAPVETPADTPSRISALASDIALAEKQRVDAEATVAVAQTAIADAETGLQALKDALAKAETDAVAARTHEIEELKEARDIITLRIDALEAS